MQLAALVVAAAAGLPPPAEPIPSRPAPLAATLSDTTLQLRAAVETWRAGGEEAVPEDVELLALHHQRIHRRLAVAPALARRTLPLVAARVRGEARDTYAARRAIGRIRRSGTPRPVRTAAAAPVEELRAAYAAAQRRFGVHWTVLASINFVESAFGKVRSASEAGARGPMQFLPATWRAYGMGGDIDDPRDAILGAANYLSKSGAPRRMRRALFAYNHSTDYVDAILRFAARMRTDERALYAYYAWQVYARTATGVKRLTGPR